MAHAPASADVPAQADGVLLIGEMAGSGYRKAPCLVRRSDGQTISLTPLLYTVLSAIDGRRDLLEVAAVVAESTGRAVTADDVATLVRKQLLPLGLLRLADGSQPELKRSDPLLGLKFRYVVTDPDVTRRVTAPFARLFHPALVAVLVAAFVTTCGWVLFEEGLAAATHEALYEPGLLLIVFVVTVLSAGFHEFGHASAARYGGATPGAMGTGLYLVWPAFYTDVTDSYRLGRAGRVRTDLGGLYFNAIVAVGMFAVWWATGWHSILLVIAAQVLQMLRQLAPLVRFDGYHVLADVTGVPDLYQHIKPTLLGLLPQNWKKPEYQVLKPWARAVVSTWVLVVVPVLLLALGLMVVTFPRVAATAWDSIGEQVDALAASFAAGDVVGLAARLLSIVAIALPLVAMVYIVCRLVRQVATAVWRGTRGRPGRRGVAVLTAAAVVAGLAWAWWPQSERYTPIRAYEGGTITDVLALSASTGFDEGSVARTSTGWPSDEPLPTPEEPALAVVMVPRDADGAATDGSASAPTEGWVFPFNRPPAPGPGDNQALAVNTTDGSTVYDVAFALVWAEEGTADNVNSAYALASCRNCTTVAVAFQVVLVVGQSDVIPQNLAGAVNYSCIECVTGALAQQLVLTVDAPSEETRSALERLWKQIADYGASLEGRSLREIRAQLSAFEAEIADLLDAEARTSDRSTATGSPVPSPSTSPTTSPTASPSGSPTASPSVTSSASATSSPGWGAASPTASPDASSTSSDDPSDSPSTGSTETTNPSPTSAGGATAGTDPAEGTTGGTATPTGTADAGSATTATTGDGS